MKMTYKIKLYIVFIHILMIGCIWISEVPVWGIILLEILLTLSMILGFWWINQIGSQFKLISSSVENINNEDLSIQFKKTGHKEFDKLISVYNHMIQQLRAERISTGEMNHLLANIIENSPSGIVLFDYDNKVKAVNPAAEALLELNEEKLTGKGKEDLSVNLSELLFYESAEWKVIQQGVNNIFRVYGGKFIDRGFETRFVLFENFAAEVHQMEKQSYEKIIRIMGHEVNNTIGAVDSVLDTYIGKHEDAYSQAFEIVKQRNDHLSQFMKRLADVVKLPLPQPVDCDLYPMIKQCVIMIKSKFSRKAIEWIFDQDETSFMTKADPVQLERVFINVLTNAAEAIEEMGQISIDIDTLTKELFIKNDGTPINEEQQINIFSPFYTTKSTGQGIGLTLTREILINHQFGYHLKTLDNGITEFYIKFG